ncbi:MAG: pyroglutamyl-peptidase I [Rubrivivax sp.]|nr:pyroglutamyl-peptidase I [Rubrivivax sp.]
MKKILLTGFDAFGGETLNPSWEVAQALHGERIGPATVQVLRLPCAFGLALEALQDALATQRPVLVLALGQAAGRGEFSIERVAVNLDDARIEDNAGAQPIDEPVVRGAPAAYFSTLPVKAMVEALRQAGLPASVSPSAGSYVCNHVFFGLMHALRRRRACRAGFMHLPLLPEQAVGSTPQPSLPLATQIQGVRLALATALATVVDLRVSGGTEA